MGKNERKKEKGDADSIHGLPMHKERETKREGETDGERDRDKERGHHRWEALGTCRPTEPTQSGRWTEDDEWPVPQRGKRETGGRLHESML